MIQCPTCKTEARPSAKFCTFCGTTLTTITDEAPAVQNPLSADPMGPERPTADPTASWAVPHTPRDDRRFPESGGEQDQLISTTWPSEDTSEGPLASSRDANRVGNPSPPDDPPAADQPSSDSAAWPSSLQSTQTAIGSGDDVESDRTINATRPDELPSGWRIVPTAGEPDVLQRETATFAIESDPVEQPEPPPTSPSVAIASAGTPLEAVDPAADTAASPEASSPLPATFPAIGESTGARTAARSFRSPPIGEAEETGLRAAELLDELRALLPALGATRLQPAALADRLEHALHTDGGLPEGLRASLDAVRANPRDIDTVLALTRLIDDIIEVIDRQDRISAALASAVRSLRYGDVE